MRPTSRDNKSSPLKGSLKRSTKVKPRNGRLRIPETGTSIGINLIDKNGDEKKVPIHLGPRSNLFYALFDEDDVDFEMDVEAGHFKDLRTGLEVHRQKHTLCLYEGKTNTFQALEQDGKSFHFVKLSGEHGQSIVAAATEKYGLSFEEAALMLSQMKFNLQFGTLIDSFKLTVKTLSGRSFQVTVYPNTLVKELKQKIFHLEKILIKEQNLVLDKIFLLDEKKLEDYNIDEKSEVWLILALRGAAVSSNASTFEDDDLSGLESETEADDDASERGIICFGDKTDADLVECQFDADDEIKLPPFVIEMRMASNYTTL